MKGERVLIDTSVWVNFFRGKDVRVIEEVSSLLTKGLVVVPGLVVTELLQGALNEKELDKILALLEPVERIGISDRTWEEAGRLSYSLRRKGITSSTVDILLATVAIENDCLLLSHDKHFELIEKNSDLRTYSANP